MGCIDRSKVNTPAGFPGKRSMSTKHMPMPQGKMSSAKGVVSASKTSGTMGGSNRVGAGKSGFKSASFKQGPCPIGSGSKASSNSYTPHKKSY